MGNKYLLNLKNTAAHEWCRYILELNLSPDWKDFLTIGHSRGFIWLVRFFIFSIFIYSIFVHVVLSPKSIVFINWYYFFSCVGKLGFCLSVTFPNRHVIHFSTFTYSFLGNSTRLLFCIVEIDENGTLKPIIKPVHAQ